MYLLVGALSNFLAFPSIYSSVWIKKHLYVSVGCFGVAPAFKIGISVFPPLITQYEINFPIGDFLNLMKNIDTKNCNSEGKIYLKGLYNFRNL